MVRSAYIYKSSLRQELKKWKEIEEEGLRKVIILCHLHGPSKSKRYRNWKNEATVFISEVKTPQKIKSQNVRKNYKKREDQNKRKGI